MMRSFLAALVALLYLPALAQAQASGGGFIQYKPPFSLTGGTTVCSGGADTRVLFNDGGFVNCGDAGFVFNKTTDSITVAGTGTFTGGLVNDTKVDKGTGTAEATIGGVLNVNTTSQATTGTSEEVLAAYTLPADTLTATGDAIRITAWGSLTGNTNNKTLRIRFGGIGGTVCVAGATATAAHTTFRMVATVIRTGAATQVCTGESQTGATLGGTAVVQGNNGTPAQTLSGTVDVVVTGHTASAIGEATFTAMVVEALN